MPRKIRELIAELENHGFVDRGDKRNLRNFTHGRVARPITVSGKAGNDAKNDQEKAVKACYSRGYQMKDSAGYIKIVEWSEEVQCFVGGCPGLLYGGCHRDDELAVFAELCAAVGEVIDLYTQDGKPLPSPTSGRDYASKMLNVA